MRAYKHAHTDTSTHAFTHAHTHTHTHTSTRTHTDRLSVGDEEGGATQQEDGVDERQVDQVSTVGQATQRNQGTPR